MRKTGGNMFTIQNFGLLLFLAALVAMAARRIKLPYTVGLVFAGLILSLTGAFSQVTLTGDLIFSVFLPPLVFEAAFAIRWRELRQDLLPVLALASLGVGVATAIIAAGMHWLVGWGWSAALLFGSLIAATDPVSVIAVFKESKVGGRLVLLVESESLLNDGIAAVVFGVVLAGATGHAVSAGSVAIDLVREIIGGVGIGLIVAAGLLALAGKNSDHLVEITFTTVAAYGSFLLAQSLHCSGLLATVSCALLMGNHGNIGLRSIQGREAVDAFWEYAAFVANSLIFLLIGVQGNRLLPQLIPLLPALGAGFLLVTVSRAVAVYSLAGGFARSRWRIEPRFQHILVWGGLRGALALALALGLPTDLAHRDEILTVTFGVVAFSILIQGVSMPALLRSLKLFSTDEDAQS